MVDYQRLAVVDPAEGSGSSLMRLRGSIVDDRTIARAQARMIRMRLEQAGLSIKDLWRNVPASVVHVDEFDVDAFLHHAIHLAPKERDLLVFAANLMLGSTIPYSWELRFDES